MEHLRKNKFSVIVVLLFFIVAFFPSASMAFFTEPMLDVKLIRQRFYPPERSVKVDENGKEVGPVYQDEGQYNCVPASVAMILTYLKSTNPTIVPESISTEYKTSVRKWFRQIEPNPMVGFRIDLLRDIVPKMTGEIVKANLVSTNSANWQEMLLQQLNAGFPVLVQIVDWRLLKNERTYRDLQAHAIVVTGLRGNEVYYQDPWVSEKDGKPTMMSVTDFAKAWGNQESWTAITFHVEAQKIKEPQLVPVAPKTVKQQQGFDGGNHGKWFDFESQGGRLWEIIFGSLRQWLNDLETIIRELVQAFAGSESSRRIQTPPVIKLAGPRFKYPSEGHRFFAGEDLVFEVYPIPNAKDYQWRIVQGGNTILVYQPSISDSKTEVRYVIKAGTAEYQKIRPAGLQVRVKVFNGQGKWTEESSLDVQFFQRAQSVPRETSPKTPQPQPTYERRGEVVQILPIMNRPVCGAATPGENGFSISGRITLGNLYGGPGVAGVFLTAGNYSATSDEQGYFTIRGVPSGSYTLVGSKDGHVSFESTMFQLSCNLTKMNYLMKQRR